MNRVILTVLTLCAYWCCAAPCLALDDTNSEPVKFVLLHSETDPAEVHVELARALELTIDQLSLESLAVDSTELLEWGGTKERVMQQMYALGLLKDAQVVLELRVNQDGSLQLLMVVLFERFAVGTSETLTGTSTLTHEAALVCRALIIEARERFIHGRKTRDEGSPGTDKGRWMHFSVPPQLPGAEPEEGTNVEKLSHEKVDDLTETGQRTEPAPEDSSAEDNYVALMPYFSLSTGIMGEIGPSTWMGGGLQLRWSVGEHFVLLAEVAADGGAFFSKHEVEVSGLRIAPAVGTGMRWGQGQASVLVFAQLKTIFARTAVTAAGHEKTDSFDVVPGLQTGVMLSWILTPAWSIEAGGTFDWLWTRYGYQGEELEAQLFASPWLEIGARLGIGYHF